MAIFSIYNQKKRINKCDKCNHYNMKPMNFCPNCGAKMKAESEDKSESQKPVGLLNQSLEEAIEMLVAIRNEAIEGTCYVTESNVEALDMAIEALKR